MIDPTLLSRAPGMIDILKRARTCKGGKTKWAVYEQHKSDVQRLGLSATDYERALHMLQREMRI